MFLSGLSGPGLPGRLISCGFDGRYDFFAVRPAFDQGFAGDVVYADGFYSGDGGDCLGDILGTMTAMHAFYLIYGRGVRHAVSVVVMMVMMVFMAAAVVITPAIMAVPARVYKSVDEQDYKDGGRNDFYPGTTLVAAVAVCGADAAGKPLGRQAVVGKESHKDGPDDH